MRLTKKDILLALLDEVESKLKDEQDNWEPDYEAIGPQFGKNNEDKIETIKNAIQVIEKLR